MLRCIQVVTCMPRAYRNGDMLSAAWALSVILGTKLDKYHSHFLLIARSNSTSLSTIFHDMPLATRSQTVRQTVAHGYAASPSRLSDQEKARNNVRLREEASGYPPSHATSQSSTYSARSKPPNEPPRSVINLSLPPEQRYLEVCEAFKNHIQGLTPLFDKVVGDLASWLPLNWLRGMSRPFYEACVMVKRIEN